MFTLFIKLKDDLTLSFPSFIREFIGTTNDGVTHLLDALKSVQLAQTNITGKIYSTKLLQCWPTETDERLVYVVQCITIDNRQSPFYVVNRVFLTGKKLC